MANKKYNLVRDWYRFGAKKDNAYKGLCGVKYYGGLHGSRKRWLEPYWHLSNREKDFLLHGQFNLVNSSWRNIHKYTYLEQAGAFPGPVRVCLHEIRSMSDVMLAMKSVSDSALDGSFFQALFAREKTSLFFFALSEKLLIRVKLDEMAIRKDCRTRSWNRIQALSRQKKSRTAAFQLAPHAMAKYIKFIPEQSQVNSSVEAIRHVSKSLDDNITESGGSLFATPTMRVLIDSGSKISFLKSFKSYIRNNDPRGNVDAAEYWNQNRREKKFIIFAYFPFRDIPEKKVNFLKAAMGFSVAHSTKISEQPFCTDATKGDLHRALLGTNSIHTDVDQIAGIS